MQSLVREEGEVCRLLSPESKNFEISQYGTTFPPTHQEKSCQFPQNLQTRREHIFAWPCYDWWRLCFYSPFFLSSHVFSKVGKIFNQFLVEFCLWLTLFDMTIHLKTAIAVSEYMELIPNYLSLIQEFKGGK